LSPHDLAAYDRLPELIAAGVSALKIEGRLKPAEYVASVTRHYRTAIDAACNSLSSVGQAQRSPTRGKETCDETHGGAAQRLTHPTLGDRQPFDANNNVLGPEEIAEMEVAFSRGFCHGWLDGPDHKALVSGQTSAKQGVLLGVVRGVRGERIAVELAGPIRRGDGVVFAGDRSQEAEQGGRVYEIFIGRHSVEEAALGEMVELAFRYGAIDRSKIELGQQVWKTDDPQAARRLRKTYTQRSTRRVPVDVVVEAAVGGVMRVAATAATGAACRFESEQALPEAVKHPLTAETLVEQFGRLGNTPYELRRLEAKLDGQAMIPLSVLGKLRHEMVRLLDAAVALPPQRAVLAESALAGLRLEKMKVGGNRETGRQGDKEKRLAGRIFLSPCLPVSLSFDLHVLCRSMEQLEAALARGASSLIADFQDTGLYGEAVRAAHAGGAAIRLATPCIHKPGDSELFERLAREQSDGVLVRNLAGLAFFRHVGLPAVADFSVNVVNDLTVEWLCSQGAQRVTAAYDLSGRQMLDLAAAAGPERLEVVVHRHTPMFHSEYCVFCGLLSSGRNQVDCGRPCQRHAVRLRDRLGVEHPLLADSQCRNTLFHAEAESLLEMTPSLLDCGVRHFRVELLLENGKEEVRKVLAAYQPCMERS
jgi:putative protease